MGSYRYLTLAGIALALAVGCQTNQPVGPNAPRIDATASQEVSSAGPARLPYGKGLLKDAPHRRTYRVQGTGQVVMEVNTNGTWKPTGSQTFTVQDEHKGVSLPGAQWLLGFNNSYGTGNDVYTSHVFTIPEGITDPKLFLDARYVGNFFAVQIFDMATAPWQGYYSEIYWETPGSQVKHVDQAELTPYFAGRPLKPGSYEVVIESFNERAFDHDDSQPVGYAAKLSVVSGASVLSVTPSRPVISPYGEPGLLLVEASGPWALSVEGRAGIIASGTGPQTVSWDGRVDGLALPDGRYTLRLASGSTTATADVAIDSSAPEFTGIVIERDEAGPACRAYTVRAHVRDAGPATLVPESVGVQIPDATVTSHAFDPVSGLLSARVTLKAPALQVFASITARDSAGNTASYRAAVDVPAGVTLGPVAPFSPNGDGTKDTVDILVHGACAPWSVSIDGVGPIPDGQGTGEGVVRWNGRVNGALLRDGAYTLRLKVGGGEDVTTPVVIDTAKPVVSYSQVVSVRPEDVEINHESDLANLKTAYVVKLKATDDRSGVAATTAKTTWVSEPVTGTETSSEDSDGNFLVKFSLPSHQARSVRYRVQVSDRAGNTSQAYADEFSYTATLAGSDTNGSVIRSGRRLLDLYPVTQFGDWYARIMRPKDPGVDRLFYYLNSGTLFNYDIWAATPIPSDLKKYLFDTDIYGYIFYKHNKTGTIHARFPYHAKTTMLFFETFTWNGHRMNNLMNPPAPEGEYSVIETNSSGVTYLKRLPNFKVSHMNCLKLADWMGKTPSGASLPPTYKNIAHLFHRHIVSPPVAELGKPSATQPLDPRDAFGYWAPSLFIDRPKWTGASSFGPKTTYQSGTGWYTEQADGQYGGGKYLITHELMNPAGVFPHSRAVFDQVLSIGEQIHAKGIASGPNQKYLPVAFPNNNVIWVEVLKYPSSPGLHSVYPFWRTNSAGKTGMIDYEANLK